MLSYSSPHIDVHAVIVVSTRTRRTADTSPVEMRFSSVSRPSIHMGRALYSHIWGENSCEKRTLPRAKALLVSLVLIGQYL